MFTYNITGISICSFFDGRRSLANGKYPIKIRITYLRIRKYYNTGVSLSEEDWQRLPNTKSSALLHERKVIQIVFSHISKIVELLAKEDLFSFENLNIRLGKSIDSTLNLAYKAKIEKLNNDGKHSSADLCNYSLKAIEGLYGENIAFNSITIDWLKNLEKYLVSNNKSYTTISMYLRELQAIINEAKKQGIIKEHQYPFGVGRYKIPQHAGRNMALSIKDIGKIVSYNCLTEIERYYRDLWIFSYLCNGANIADLGNLRYDNIKRGNIEFYRQKTLAKSKIKKTVVAFITIEMQNIIDEWGNNKVKGTEFIFPILNSAESPLEKRSRIKSITRSINHYMQKIGKNLGIGNISTYTARHSFATVLKRSGSNIAFISESLGHSNLKTTENYLASFEDDERKKNALMLTNFSDAV